MRREETLLLFQDEGQVEEEAYEASEEEAQEDEVEVKRLCIFQVIYHDLFGNILIGQG